MPFPDMAIFFWARQPMTEVLMGWAANMKTSGHQDFSQALHFERRLERFFLFDRLMQQDKFGTLTISFCWGRLVRQNRVGMGRIYPKNGQRKTQRKTGLVVST